MHFNLLVRSSTPLWGGALLVGCLVGWLLVGVYWLVDIKLSSGGRVGRSPPGFVQYFAFLGGYVLNICLRTIIISTASIRRF